MLWQEGYHHGQMKLPQAGGRPTTDEEAGPVTWRALMQRKTRSMTREEGRPEWACPSCAGGLECSDEECRCASCGRFWPVVDGVPHFVSEAPYWGEIPESKLQDILEATRTAPWREVFRASNDPDIARAFTFIANLNRTSWQYFLPSGNGRSALCVGEGMGATADALSPNYATVVAMEPVLARVQFMRRRFIQDRVDNVRVVRASFPRVPFPRESFDLVVFNGVVEWLPSGHPS
jgi:Methyltransferase domain